MLEGGKRFGCGHTKLWILQWPCSSEVFYYIEITKDDLQIFIIHPEIEELLSDYAKLNNAIGTLLEIAYKENSSGSYVRIREAEKVLESHFDDFEKLCYAQLKTISGNSNEVFERCLLDIAQSEISGLDVYSLSRFLIDLIAKPERPSNLALIAREVIPKLNRHYFDTPFDQRDELVANHLEIWYDFMQSFDDWTEEFVEVVGPVFEVLPLDPEDGSLIKYDHIIKGMSVLCSIGSQSAKSIIEQNLNHSCLRVREHCANVLKRCFKNLWESKTQKGNESN